MQKKGETTLQKLYSTCPHTNLISERTHCETDRNERTMQLNHTIVENGKDLYVDLKTDTAHVEHEE